MLLVGVPGSAKTLLIQTIAQALDMEFSRIQFTPDLMPSDITGTELLEEDHGTGKRSFIFSKDPVFGNILLADEINRAPPKAQAALLQAMQEKTVTVAGKTYTLPDPYFVPATQNPIEQERTYHLPEAQLDRFMYQLRMDYPSVEEDALKRRVHYREQRCAEPGSRSSASGRGEYLVDVDLVQLTSSCAAAAFIRCGWAAVRYLQVR